VSENHAQQPEDQQKDDNGADDSATPFPSGKSGNASTHETHGNSPLFEVEENSLEVIPLTSGICLNLSVAESSSLFDTTLIYH